MQKRKNIKLLILLAALSAITAAVYFVGGRSNSLTVDEQHFILDEYTRVNRITLASAESDVTLSFNGSRWRVNDSLLADRAMIEVLFATLSQAKPKRALSAGLADSVANLLETGGVHVTLYEDESPVQEFVAGGNTKKTQAYFMDRKERVPYVMHIPGYRVYVSGIFELNTAGWRDKYVFGFNWQNFSDLKVTFPGEPTESFEVYLDGRVARIRGMQQADTAKLNSFLDAVSLLTVDEYVGASADSIRPVLVDLLVTDIGKRTYRLSIRQRREGEDDFYGVLQGQETVRFAPRKLPEIIRKRSFFAH